MSGNPSDIEARIRRLERLANGTDRRVKAIEDALSLAGPMIRTIGRIVGGSTPVESGVPMSGAPCATCTDTPITLQGYSSYLDETFTLTYSTTWNAGALNCSLANRKGWKSNVVNKAMGAYSGYPWWAMWMCCFGDISVARVYLRCFQTEAAAEAFTATLFFNGSSDLSVSSCSPVDWSGTIASATAMNGSTVDVTQ